MLITVVSAESLEIVEGSYESPPQGEKLHKFYMDLGKAMYYSQRLEDAREAFERLLEIDSQDAQVHYFLGLIEYEEGNIEKAKIRFRIAHECLGSSLGDLQLPVDEVQFECSDDYRARVYYKDGWYTNPKDPSDFYKSVHSLAAGSTYKIELKSERKKSWFRKGVIGFVLVFGFVMAR